MKRFIKDVAAWFFGWDQDRLDLETKNSLLQQQAEINNERLSREIKKSIEIRRDLTNKIDWMQVEIGEWMKLVFDLDHHCEFLRGGQVLGEIGELTSKPEPEIYNLRKPSSKASLPKTAIYADQPNWSALRSKKRKK